MMAAKSSNAPKMDPTTIPAIWPPLKPLLLPPEECPAPVVGLPVADAVMVTGCKDADAIIGSVTPSHRVVVLEKTQHESVAFGELAEQYEHRPERLSVKPQLSGWF